MNPFLIHFSRVLLGYGTVILKRDSYSSSREAINPFGVALKQKSGEPVNISG
jgi:hypothetical protein